MGCGDIVGETLFIKPSDSEEDILNDIPVFLFSLIFVLAEYNF